MPAIHLLLLAFPGFLAAHRAALPPHIAAAPLLLALLLHALLRKRRAGRALVPLLPAAAAFAAWEARTAPAGPAPPHGPVCRIEARLLARPDRSRAAPVRVTAGPGAGDRFLLRLPREGPHPEAGAAVEGTGRFEPYGGRRNPHAPDRAAGERRRGGRGVFRAERIRVLHEERSFLEPVAARFRACADHLGGEEGALFLALFLGDRSRLSPETAELFRRTGLAHLLALSGLHLGIFYAILRVPLGLLPVPRRGIPIAALALLWLFGATARFPVSLLRALTMGTLLAGGRLLERRPSPGNALGVAALVSLAVDPAAWGEISFQLSFSATAGILAALPLLRPLLRRRAGRFLAAPLLAGAAAQAATLPAVLWHFGRFAPLGAAATLGASPSLLLTLAAGSAWTALGPLHPAAERILGHAAWGGASGLLHAVSLADRFLPGAIRLPAEDARGAAAALLLILATLLLRRRRTALFLLVGLSPLPVLLFHDPWPLRITVLDVGQGSAAMIETAGGERVLIDAGPRWGEFDAGRSVLLPFLRRRGGTPIDRAVISHPDGDHIGGLAALLREGAVRRLVENGLARGEGGKDPGDGIVRSSALRGARFPFREGASLTVLSAPEGRVPPSRSNASSLVLLLRYGRFSMLFPGDAVPETERELERLGAARGITVLVAPHHGAKGGCPFPFLLGARPAATIVSCGRNNRYGHPDPGVLARVARAGSVLFRTDRHGAVIVETDGRRARIRAVRPEAPRLEFPLPYRPAPRRLFAGGDFPRCDRIAD